MTLTRLTLACWDYDRTQPILDGRITVPGFELDCAVLSPEQAFPLAFAEAPYDVTEISLSNTVTAVSKEPASRADSGFAYWLLPIFLSRAFRHAALYVRTDRGIETPADLAGKTIGLQEFDMTAAVVLRGTLRDEFGVDWRSCRWRVGESHHHKRLDFPITPAPADLRMEILPEGTTLEERLLRGELDALISLRTLHAFVQGDRRVARLFADPRAAERRTFERTGVFPIMHALAVRKSLVARHPHLPQALLEAFGDAKRIAIEALEIAQASKVTLPWINDWVRDVRALMGQDYWPYGLGANRHALETQLRWSREDGLQARPVSIEELFAPSMHDT